MSILSEVTEHTHAVSLLAGMKLMEAEVGVRSEMVMSVGIGQVMSGFVKE